MKKMHRNLLQALNSLLAAIIAMLGVTSCHSQKRLAKEPAIEQPAAEEQPQIMVKYGVPFRREEQVICMYGVPSPMPAIEADTIPGKMEIEEIQPDTVAIRSSHIMVKYGVPPVLNKQ